jgi:hypothetical protein
MLAGAAPSLITQRAMIRRQPQHATNCRGSVIRLSNKRDCRHERGVGDNVQNGFEQHQIARRQTDASTDNDAFELLSVQALGQFAKIQRVGGNVSLVRVVASRAKIIESARDAATDDLCIESGRQGRIRVIHFVGVDPESEHAPRLLP